jgi:hypothetical protein
MANTAVARAKVIPNLPADLREELNADVVSIKDRIGAPGGDYISATRNKTFRLPGADNEAQEMTGVIIDWVSFNQFYEGRYDPNAIKPAVCGALGINPEALTPMAQSPKKQAENCKACPQNQWGSDGKGRACKNQRLIAIANPLDPALPFALLKVSPAAIKFFDKYVATLANAQKHPVEVVTKFFFDPSVEYPSVRFEIVEPNTDTAAYAALRKTARARLLTEPDMGGAAAVKK